MQRINSDKLQQLKSQCDGLTVVNVLSPDQFRAAHIPGSVNVPVGAPDFVEQIRRAAGGDDQPVAVYCASESCDASEKAAEQLDEAGFSAVYDYVGGMRAWEEAGGAVQGGPAAGR